MARRRKISRRMPPLRQVVPGSQGINNWSQDNIDQNQAASFSQQYGNAGNYAISTNAYGGAAVSPYTTRGNTYSGYGASNTSQNKVTGATSMNQDVFNPTVSNNNTFRATTIPGSTHWNTGEHQLSDPNMLTDTGRGFDLNKGGSVNTTNKEGLNTFSSEIDPTDKTEFQNEVVNNIIQSDPVADLSKPVESARPQNKFEELYKPS